SIAPAFREGGFFEQGEELLTIDDHDYVASVEIARAALAQADLRLTQETARSEQAAADWAKLGKETAPGDLVLRKPQMAEAKAMLEAEKARLALAERNLERTRIHAPFAGRVLTRNVDLGKFVGPGSELARIYAVDYAEVLLPLSEKEQGFIELPEKFRHETDAPDQPQPAVRFTVEAGRETHTWTGRVVRTEGMVDVRSRQLSVVAQVDDPYQRRKPGQPPLKMGQFVNAEIDGIALKKVLVVPRKAIRSGGEVLVIDPENKVRRRKIEMVWQERDSVYVDRGLEHGETISITPIPFAVDGLTVRRQSEAGKAGKPRPNIAGAKRHEKID
ncbi:MAG: efflux RND transporter periplasmic adaptor subunit, partial [Verrucomicrobiota bacterium]